MFKTIRKTISRNAEALELAATLIWVSTGSVLGLACILTGNPVIGWCCIAQSWLVILS